MISAMASLAPSRMEAPIGAEPPVKGPVRAILTVSAAYALSVNNPIVRAANIVFFMISISVQS